MFRIRLLTILCSLMCFLMVSSQSSGDRLYNEGLKRQKVMTVKAQNEAIAKFNSAKKIYDSKAKKSQCDQAISVSREIINSLSSGGSKGGKNNVKKEQSSQPSKPAVAPTLSLSNSEFNINSESKKLNVTVTTNQSDFNVKEATCLDGSSFLSIIKNGKEGFSIIVPYNGLTFSRDQKVIVSAGGLQQEVLVVQQGRNIDLSVSENMINLKHKGGTKKLTVLCNADQRYEDNGGKNWFVRSQPGWTKVMIDEKGGKKNKISSLLGKGKPEDPKMKSTNIQIVCDPLRHGFSEYKDGRTGEIVLESGDKTVSIHIVQAGYDK